MTLKIILSADGSGSCLQAAMNFAKKEHIDIDIVAFMSNNPGCYAMAERAAKNNVFGDRPRIEIPVQKKVADKEQSNFVNGKRGMKTRAAHEAEIMKELDKFDFDYLVLLGDMRVKSKEFVKKYAGKILNTHPAPIPQFRGIGGYEWAVGKHPQSVQVNEWNCATFHYIDDKVDRGIIAAQTPMIVYPDDTADRLSERGLPQEHWQICEFLKYLSEKRVVFREKGIADVLDQHGEPYREQMHIATFARIQFPTADEFGINVKEKNGRYLITLSANGKTIDDWVTGPMPDNLAFTYAHWDVEQLRQGGYKVDFKFNDLNIHPVIMKKDQEAGLKPL